MESRISETAVVTVSFFGCTARSVQNSFGSFSDMGSRFVERMLTVVQTLRQQGRRVIAFLSDTVKAHRTGLPLPTLVAA